MDRVESCENCWEPSTATHPQITERSATADVHARHTSMKRKQKGAAAEDFLLASLLEDMQSEHSKGPESETAEKSSAKQPQSLDRSSAMRLVRGHLGAAVPPPGQSTLPANVGAAPTSTRPPATIPPGYYLDSNSGFHYCAEKACYLDPTAERHLYCDMATCEWRYFDARGQAFRPYPPERLTPAHRALLVRLAPANTAAAVAMDDCVAAIEAAFEGAAAALHEQASGEREAEAEAAPQPAAAPQPLPEAGQRPTISFSAGLGGKTRDRFRGLVSAE